VAVLMGGPSSEREISFLSGNAVLAALRAKGVDAHAFDPKERPLADLAANGSSASSSRCTAGSARTAPCRARSRRCAFRTRGSGVMAPRSRWTSGAPSSSGSRAAFRRPRYAVVDSGTDWMRVVAELGLPLIVKPAREGSTIGITKVTGVDHGELAQAHAVARAAR
jgi:D-alanine-D-alanine ligase